VPAAVERTVRRAIPFVLFAALGHPMAAEFPFPPPGRLVDLGGHRLHV
jgi:hypothetical protein